MREEDPSAGAYLQEQEAPKRQLQVPHWPAPQVALQELPSPQLVLQDRTHPPPLPLPVSGYSVSMAAALKA